MAHDQTSTFELLEAMDKAHEAVKQLRQAVALSVDRQIGAVCGSHTLTLSDDLAKLERIVGNLLRKEKAAFQARQSPPSILPSTPPSSPLAPPPNRTEALLSAIRATWGL